MACGNEENFKLKVRVTNQDGERIEDATVWTTGDYETKSDAEGLATVKFRKQLRIPVGAYKDGFYQSGGIPVFPYGKNFDVTKQMEIVLKEKKNPIPMLVKSWNHGSSSGLKIPDTRGSKVGYDFIIGDWVKPFGKGIRSDIFFKKEGDWDGKLDDSNRLDLKISFPSSEDGLIPFEVPLPLFEQGKFRSDYEAPKNGYLNHWIQTVSNIEGRRMTTKKRERNYYFRIRTVVDANGKIVSAHYGKIYGDFMSLIYYVNPTPNDRNVEFDVEQNLFKSTTERIRKIDRP